MQFGGSNVDRKEETGCFDTLTEAAAMTCRKVGETGHHCYFDFETDKTSQLAGAVLLVHQTVLEYTDRSKNR